MVHGGRLLLAIYHLSPCISKEVLAEILSGACATAVTEIKLLFAFTYIIFGRDKCQPENTLVLAGEKVSCHRQ